MILISLFSSIIIIIIGGYDCHQITLTPNRTDFHLNETATLTCPVPSNSSDDRIVKWYRNGYRVWALDVSNLDGARANILAGSEERMKANGNKLEFLKITRRDSGIYRCCWSFESKIDDCAYDVSLRVYAPPIYVRGTPERGAYADEQVEFGYQFEGYPEPTVYWRRENDVPFFNGRLVYNGTDVVIPKMSKKDEGLYYCFAENGVGTPKKRTTRVHFLERRTSR